MISYVVNVRYHISWTAINVRAQTTERSLYGTHISLRPRDAYVSVGKVNISCSDNGLSPDLHQAIVWSTADLFVVDWIAVVKLQWHLSKHLKHFIQENTFENVVCEMAAICVSLNVLTHCVCQQCHFISYWIIFIEKNLSQIISPECPC